MPLEVRPEGRRGLTRVQLDPVLAAVPQEGAEAAGEEVLGNRQQHAGIELEVCGEHLKQLPDGVQELQEHGRSLGVGVVLPAVAVALLELVPEVEPFLVEEDEASVLTWSSSV